MSATDELIAYGYAEEDGEFVRRKAGRLKDKYVPTEGGWLRFNRDDGAWVPVDFTMLPKWQGVAGLHPSTHPECYDYVHPDSWVETEYAAANQNRQTRLAESLARKAAAV